VRLPVRSAWALALVHGLVLGCTPDPGEAYAKAFAEGQRAMVSGRYDEAGAAFARAAAEAQRLKDRDEALFLIARAREDARDYAGAKKAYADVIATSPDGPRTARAAYALAYLEIEHGDAEAGYSALEETLFARPNHGSADRALQELADRAEERGGAPARVAFLTQAEPRFRGTELHEQAGYRLGLALYAVGQKEEAKARLVLTAEAHPHPYGGLTDDAYWHAARIAHELGRPKEALSLLERLLAPQERSTMNGSYIRRRFPPALLRMAVILRDDLKDLAAARKKLLELPSRFPDSILRDDALWEAARLSHLVGDAGAACDALEDLVELVPESRYGACVTLLCPGQKPVGDRPCADYVSRDLAEGRGVSAPSE
jgi:tetratricopeptide (TPR) repeat protein